MIPKQGTLERVVLDKLQELGQITYMDMIGTGVTEDNIDKIVQNLRNGMYESEDDDLVRFDA